MKVSKAIKMLSGYEPNDDLVIAWWDYEGINGRITPQQWTEIADAIDEEYDYHCFQEASDFVYAMVDAKEVENENDLQG